MGCNQVGCAPFSVSYTFSLMAVAAVMCQITRRL